MPFSGSFILKSPDITSQTEWELQEDFTWHSPRGDVVVPKDFLTDGTSVPRILWDWIPPIEAKTTRAALPHDLFYTLLSDGNTPHPLAQTRREADDMLYLAARDAGISILSAYIMWIGVRLFGRSHVTNRGRKPTG